MQHFGGEQSFCNFPTALNRENLELFWLKLYFNSSMTSTPYLIPNR